VRILQVEKFLHRSGGGAAAYMLDLTALQRQSGHEVELFGMADDRNEPTRYQDRLAPAVQLEPPPEGVPARVIGAARLIWSRHAHRAMAAVVADFRPDVAHLHNVYHQLTPSVVRALAAAGVPTVMTVHDYKLVCPSYRMLDQTGPCSACLDNRFRHAVQRRCDGGDVAKSALLALETRVHRTLGSYDAVGAFLCPSRFLLDQLAASGAYDGRLQHLPHFVDLDGVPARTGPGGGFVFAGRLSHEKGVDVLVRAIGQLPAERLTVVGDGPERTSLETLAAGVAPGRVRFAGYLPRHETLAALRGARAAVLPARWYENQPMSVLEAMASAVAPVVSGIGGCPELVEDGVTGRVVPPDDVDALAAALAQLAADPDGAVRMGRAARQCVADRFDPRRHLQAVTGAYERVAAVAAAKG
jgi:glycosyltransferase involved in cell wall biosynthesis